MKTQSCDGRDLCLANDDSSSQDHDEPHKMDGDEENINPCIFSIKAESPAVIKSKLKDRRSLMKRQESSRRRRRRRSSARFLKIVPDTDDGDDTSGEGFNFDGTSTTNLGEVYRNAIRMNAENRINASNSWNLNLIDHLDRFVVPELRYHPSVGHKERNLLVMTGDTTGRVSNTESNGIESTTDSTVVSGVNFTKASCTLDASVKIYSYRVDDVHLTSYKVLANLNRTDNSTKANGKTKHPNSFSDSNSDIHADDDGKETSSRIMKPKVNSNSVETIELTTTNINIHKLDAAFDIDPLFHKMSKTFDEGGAKGLLLANLGVGYSGCSIIFDSTLDDEDEVSTSLTAVNKNYVNKDLERVQQIENISTSSNPAVDVSSLLVKLESLLSNASEKYRTVDKMPLVPQLASLRNQYAELGKGGFVEEVVKFSKRYASSLKDEDQADKSIHLEAIERSRLSQADLRPSQHFRDSFGTCRSHDDGSYSESGIDYGVDDDDVFGGIHDGNHRFSSSSFAPALVSLSSFGDTDNNNMRDGNMKTPTEPRQSSPRTYSQASVLLDAIASGHIFTQQHNHYEYFNSSTLKTLTSGNVWAGAEHWKKMPPSRRRKDGVGIKNGIDNAKKSDGSVKKKGPRRKKNSTLPSNTLSIVSISKSIRDLKVFIEKPKRRRGKNATDPLQLTKATRTKYSKVDNLLPMDAGLEVNDLMSLFLCPKVNLLDFLKRKNVDAHAMKASRSVKVVGFSGVETWDTDDVSGNGLDFGGSDNGFENDDSCELVVPPLEDVRRVDKINIGYATTARKVDVKRLKRDLWNELEQTFSSRKLDIDDVEEKTKEKDESEECDVFPTLTMVSNEEQNVSVSNNDNTEELDSDDEKVETDNDITTLSFQETVRDMQINQSQSDVTVPFYFICILHLCNEKGLALESSGLEDFVIHSN